MAIVQSKSSGWVTSGLAITLVLNTPPVSGNRLVGFLWTEGANGSSIDTAGWSQLAIETFPTVDAIQLFNAPASSGATIHVTTSSGGTQRNLTVYEVDDDIEVYDSQNNGAFASSGIGTIDGPDLTQAEEAGVILAAFAGKNQTYVPVATFTAVAPLSAFGAAVRGGRMHAWSGSATTTPGTYNPRVTVTGLTGSYHTASVAVILSHDVPALPVADFTADDFTPSVGEPVQFTDLSTGTPTSWLWDFGDGATSTSQHPVHSYTALGIYTITLTATNANGSDDEVKTAYLTVSIENSVDEPPPAGVLLEIYAADPGSARWDHANWDEAVWSTAGWQDVTPQGIDVQIFWGSNRPELGILNRPDAASWAVSFFDPDRILDPANADGPYQADLIAGLPIRCSHRGVIIRVGFAESIGHAYADTMQNGYIRATDNVSRLANAKVPSDTDLGDTLYTRAADAIAAAGLAIRVLDPISTDPAIAPWMTGVNEWSAWQWIVDAAEQVNYIAIVDRLGNLTFRPWASPLSRGRSIDSPELIDLQVISDYSGQFSVIKALDDDGVTIETRALTPPPRYGARTYERTDPTINAGDWAATVLADRALPGLRWVPGTVYPLTANAVEGFATIEAVELVSMAVPEQDPPVSATAIIVGGKIRIRGKRNAEAVWLFEFQAAQTATEPLIESGGGPTDYLLATGGDQFLYPST